MHVGVSFKKSVAYISATTEMEWRLKISLQFFLAAIWVRMSFWRFLAPAWSKAIWLN